MRARRGPAGGGHSVALAAAVVGLLLAFDSRAADPAPAAGAEGEAVEPRQSLQPLPTPAEWMALRRLELEAEEKKLEELELLKFRAPDVDVVSMAPIECPRGRREPSFEILFDESGRVAALVPVAGDCIPLQAAWQDSIRGWQLRPPDQPPGLQPYPALIRITLRLGSRPKSVGPISSPVRPPPADVSADVPAD